RSLQEVRGSTVDRLDDRRDTFALQLLGAEGEAQADADVVLDMIPGQDRALSLAQVGDLLEPTPELHHHRARIPNAANADRAKEGQRRGLVGGEGEDHAGGELLARR